MADKSRFGSPGNGMRSSWRYCRRGADPLRNESGIIGASYAPSCRCVISGNGCCIAAKTSSNSEPELPQRSILHTRLLRPSATTMLSTPDVGEIRPWMTRGKAGQMSSMALAGVRGVQRSCRFRRRLDVKRRVLHRGHMCASNCHACVSRASPR
jgi:hypothetical protein